MGAFGFKQCFTILIFSALDSVSTSKVAERGRGKQREGSHACTFVTPPEVREEVFFFFFSFHVFLQLKVELSGTGGCIVLLLQMVNALHLYRAFPLFCASNVIY